jgi:hypothetical protein
MNPTPPIASLSAAAKKVYAVTKRIADEEIRHRRYGEIGQDLHQRIHLVFLAHGADFQKREPGVHRQHHHRAKQN